MLTKFMEEIGGKLAERWLATFLTPASVFWLGGWGILVYGYGWANFWNGFKSYSNPTKILLVIAGLAVITLSALVAQQFQLLVLRLLEGYWPNWKAILKAREFFLHRLNQKYNDTYSQWRPLKLKELDTVGSPLTTAEFLTLRKLELQLKHIPPVSSERMPTRLGNVLRAAELRSRDNYGLDAIICWPRLWLTLPAEAKVEIREARAALDNGVRVFIWGGLFFIWVIWAAGWQMKVLVVLLSLAAITFAYYWLMLTAAKFYGELLESTFDVYRLNLYNTLRWPSPPSPSEETEFGKAITQYLWRGQATSQQVFTEADKKPPMTPAPPQLQTLVVRTPDLKSNRRGRS